MAEGLLRHDAADRFEVESAGTKPGIVRPEAIAVIRRRNRAKRSSLFLDALKATRQKIDLQRLLAANLNSFVNCLRDNPIDSILHSMNFES